MSREVPFDPDEICDQCGCDGAYDFQGDLLCSKCAGLTPSDTDSDDDLLKDLRDDDYGC